MDMKTKVLIVAAAVVFGFSIQIFAGELANSGGVPADGSAKNSSLGCTANDTRCECKYIANQCEAYKNSLPEKDRKKVMSCDDNDTDLLKDDAVGGCFHGVFDATVMALINLPSAIGTIIKSDQECNADPMAKMMLLRTVYHAYEPEMLKIMVDKWTCADIRREADNRANSFHKTIDAKKLKIKLEMDGQGKHLSEDELEKLVAKELTPQEAKFRAAVGPREDPAKRMRDRYGKVWNCFSRYESLRLICDDVTTGLTAAAGVVGLSKLAGKAATKAAKAIPEMSEAAKRAERVAVKGSRFDWLSDGTWLERHHKSIGDPLTKKLTELPGRYRIYGEEVTYHSPFPGAHSLSVFHTLDRKTGFSVFTGWENSAGRTTQAGAKLMKIAEEVGMKVDGPFIGTTDPAKMLEFLRRVER